MDITESAFEAYITSQLADLHGYHIRPASAYDPENCLDWEILVEFITATQPQEWNRLQRQHGSDIVKKFRQRLVSEIKRSGTLSVLRKGISDSGCTFSLAYFKPSTTLNPVHWELYRKNILSVIRQCHFSVTHPAESIDMVLFINGMPIFTLELKNKLTGQNVDHARQQYRNDRKPEKSPLLEFKRCLAHYAVDDDEVYMTTHLEGLNTRFLPFNKGADGGAGNPINPSSYPTAYFWEDFFAPESVLEILGSFAHLQKEIVNGRTIETLILPRYHQRVAVRKIISHALQHGPGHQYLIQHSAGSGKSNTISWLAHRLSSLHGEDNKRIFDSVIVITDRLILDKQLQHTVMQFEQVPGLVSVIDKDSAQLAQALEIGSDIIVTTLQKFPFVLDKVESLAGHNYAVIVDEAHSSQSGEASAALKKTLTVDTLEEAAVIDEQQEDPTDEDNINEKSEKISRLPNLSFFAFTATPKSKTLELFGSLQEDGSYKPFHLYSMRQAIEEGFILNVLQNYTTYQTYFNLLKTAEDDPKVEKSKAIGILKRFVSLNEISIERLIEIMVEHYISITSRKIPDAQGNGRAKSMIVTRSRLHAVRYKLAFDSYVAAQGYPIKALVAFSGKVHNSGLDYSESQMNGIPESQTADAFKKPEFHFLIVAEKFQTGFDMPLLHTMYVDKVLTGVNAVQTLSRLNRIFPGKTDTMVLDFANTQNDILKYFQPYYEQTILIEGTNPNILYDYQNDLMDFHLFTVDVIDKVAALFNKKGEKAAELQPILNETLVRYKAIAEKEERVKFQRLMHSYISLYGFLSQVITFIDASLEHLYIFSRLLVRKLPPESSRMPFNIEEKVDLESIRRELTATGAIPLSYGNGKLDPPGKMGETPGSETKALSEIIKEINERFGTKFTDEDRVIFFNLKSRLVTNDELKNSTKENDKESVQLFFDALFEKELKDLVEKNFDLFKRINDNVEFGNMVRRLLFEQVYKDLVKK